MGDLGKWAGARLKWGGKRIGRLMALGATLVSRGVVCESVVLRVVV